MKEDIEPALKWAHASRPDDLRATVAGEATAWRVDDRIVVVTGDGDAPPDAEQADVPKSTPQAQATRVEVVALERFDATL